MVKPVSLRALNNFHRVALTAAASLRGALVWANILFKIDG